MKTSLFDEFESISSKAWKQKIQADLKGADYNDTLIWNTPEGIDVKPFYHADDFEHLPEISRTKATEWKICQAITVETAKSANTKAVDAINRGAESISFYISSENIKLSELLQDINLDNTIIHIHPNFLSLQFVQAVNDFNKNINIHTDIIYNLAKMGNWYYNLNEDHNILKEIVSTTNQLNIHLDLYQNAGANNVQQLAYAMAHANEYLNYLELNKASEITFHVAVGSNYFFEIAKLRALRQLWSTLASEYGVHTDCKIIATPSRRNKTIYDYNVNMLRTATECMSAVLGGADEVCNLTYDAIFHNANEFGERISRNQLLVLKHESYFNTVDNPADGAYYIENLTQQLAEKALDIFKSIEAKGGFLSLLKEGTIQRKIKESASKEQADFDAEKLILLGTNKHPNAKDKMKHDLEVYPFLTVEKRKTLIEPIIEKRLAERLEQERLKSE